MTSRPDPSHLVSGHATETLSSGERRQLYGAALDDQEIFDRLVEEESWRQVFTAPGVRSQLLEALSEPGQRGIRGWLDRLRFPVPSLAMGAAAAALLAVVLVPRWSELGVTDPAATGEAPPTELVAKSYGGPDAGTRSLRPKSTDSAPAARDGVLNLAYTLELNQPAGPRQVPDRWSFLAGDQFRLRLNVDFAAWLYLFNRADGDDAYTVLYPHDAEEVNPLSPFGRDVVLPSGVWLTMDDTPEDEQLVLVVSTRPLPIAPVGRDTLPASELDAALAQAENDFAALNWRRSEVGDRVQLTVEDSDVGVVAVLRLLGK